jgi:CheY-like chemotaxis protein
MEKSRTRKILVVEDEPTISDVCRRILTREGFEVEIGGGSYGQEQMELVSCGNRSPVRPCAYISGGRPFGGI